MRFFFYGTLLDVDLRRVLCGPAADGWAMAPAVLADHRRGRSPGRTYPFLLPAAGQTVDGMTATGLGTRDAAILTLYEGSGYRTACLLPMGADGPVEAWTFLPRRPVSARLPWSLEAWTGAHKAASLQRIAEWRESVPATDLDRAERRWRARLAEAG